MDYARAELAALRARLAELENENTAMHQDLALHEHTIKGAMAEVEHVNRIAKERTAERDAADARCEQLRGEVEPLKARTAKAWQEFMRIRATLGLGPLGYSEVGDIFGAIDKLRGERDDFKSRMDAACAVVRAQATMLGELRSKNDNKPDVLDLTPAQIEKVRDERDALRERLAGADKERGRCPHCGAFLYSGPPDCPGCGAPQCCQQCCTIQNLRDGRNALRAENAKYREALDLIREGNVDQATRDICDDALGNVEAPDASK